MKHIALTALLFCFANSAWGAGYQLRYQGAESMGTAFSSAGSYGESLSSIYYNPALFLNQDKDQSMALELMVLHPTTAEFTSATGQITDDYADTSLSGGFYYGYKVDAETAFTVSITTPWGTKSDYGTTWDGRYAAIKTELATINMQPVISKKMTDKFMFSIGPQIQYMTGKLSSATATGPSTPDLISELDASNMSVGGVLSLTYMPSEKTTFGFNFTSRVKHSLKGDIKFTPRALADVAAGGFGLADSTDAETEIVTPEVFTLSATHWMSDRLAGHFSASYTNWSVFKDLTVNANNVIGGALPISSTIPQNWDDTYMLALGTTFEMSEFLVLRGGLSYETGAVDNAFRTPRSQDTDRVGLALGTSFALGGVILDLALNHIIYTGDVDMAIASDLANGKPGVQGTYDVSATLLRVGAEYRF